MKILSAPGRVVIITQTDGDDGPLFQLSRRLEYDDKVNDVVDRSMWNDEQLAEIDKAESVMEIVL